MWEYVISIYCEETLGSVSYEEIFSIFFLGKKFIVTGLV